MINLFIALTIGPIYETFAQTKKTRAVWAASYFFSWFMKELVLRTHNSGFKILLPAINGEKIVFRGKHGSGLYADRIYFEPSDKKKKDLDLIVNNLISEIADNIDVLNKVEVSNYLRQFLNIHIVELEINEKSKVLEILNQQLDQKELSQNYPFENEINFLLQFFDQKINESFLAEDAFGTTRNEMKFLSIPEIATTTLARTDKDGIYKKARNSQFTNEDIDLLDTLKEQDLAILPYHKYYAVLYADGDDIGKNILNHKAVAADFGKLKQFSEKIFKFGQQAEEKIAQYGGSGIYFGGEDILAFLPVACIDETGTQTNTIFNLIHELDYCFENTVGSFAIDNNLIPPTLSYGIMIAYIKHPLREAMDTAHNLMESMAKKQSSKNAVAVRFQKHSGQYMECCIEKSKSVSWNHMTELIKEYTFNIHDDKKEDRESTGEILASVIHRLKDDIYFDVFASAARGNRLESFFQNFFDEKVHKGYDNPKNIFLRKVRELSAAVFEEYHDNQKCRDIIFTVLRYIHFINSKKE